MSTSVEAECAFTAEGDELLVCGSPASLGGWDPTKGLQLRTDAVRFPLWQGRLPRNGCQFKLVIRRADQSFEWEQIGNRVMPLRVDGCLFMRFGVVGETIKELPWGDREIQLPKLARAPSQGDGLRCRFISGDLSGLSERYQLEEKTIGEGGYGSVYRAYDKALKTMRAIKRIEKSRALSMQDVNREIEMLKAMDHPNIIRLYATMEDEHFLYLVMELCEGGELFDALVAATQLCEPTVQLVMRQVFGAVSHMHGKEVVHRDLKPENFILQRKLVSVGRLEDSPLKLIDFGLACYCKENEKLSAALGTVLYVAPEVLAESYSHACDVWSCGVLMYCLLCGSPPFNGKSQPEILAKVQRGKYTMRGAHWMPVSSLAKQLVARCLQKDVSQRISAVEAMTHEWFAVQLKDETPRDLHRDLVGNLKSFCVLNRFKKAAMTAAAYHLTEEEQKELRRVFERLDEDRDGFMTLDDLRRGLADPQMRGLNLAQLMDDLDRNQDGRLEYTEFIAAAMDQKLHENEALCWRAFKAFDRDDDDRITFTDLQHVLQDPELQLEVPNCRSAWQYFARMDQDGDGLVTFTDFISMLRSQNTPESKNLYQKATFGILLPSQPSTELGEDDVSEELS